MPFEGGDINGVGTDEVRCAPDFVAFQDGKSPPLDLAERDRIRGFCISQRTLTSARLGLANRLNLDFHVAAVDHHPIARDSLARGRPHDSTGFEIKIRSMPRTGYVGSCYRPFREGPAAMSAGVANSIESSFGIEEGDFLAFHVEGGSLARRQVFCLSDFD